MNGLVRHSLAEETEIPKVSHKDHIDNFFPLSRHSAQIFLTRRKTLNTILCKGVMDRHLKEHLAGSSSCGLLFTFFLVAR
jgi:hypothetical protein